MPRVRSLSVALVTALLCSACDDGSTGTADAAPDRGVDRGPATPDGPPADQQPLDLGAPDAAAADLPADDTGVPPPADRGPIPDVGGSPYADYVVDAVLLPSTAAQGTQYGFDLDGNGTVDNALGTILAAVTGLAGGLTVQPAVDEAVNTGELLLLFRLFTADLVNQPSLVAHHWRAVPTQCCTSTYPPTCAAEAKAGCFSGSYTFTPVPPETQLLGTLAAGDFSFGPTSLQLAIPLFGGALIDVTLLGARLRGTLAGWRIADGAIGGAISQQDIDNQVIPAIAMAMDRAYQLDPVGNAVMGQLFDTNKDGKIETAEVAANPLITTFLTPDVDVDGDGTKEMSIGIAFTAVGATIL